MDDIAIENVTVLDGSGASPFLGSIGLHGESVSSVARCRRFPGSARRRIDGSGLYAAPGFIDLHSHADFTLKNNPLSWSKVLQGVTTEVVGNCGLTAAPVRERTFPALVQYLTNTVAISEEEKASWRWESMMAYMEECFSAGASVNLAPLVGQGTIRVSTMGFADRAPSPEEMREMERLTVREMQLGAFGLSTGLQYIPNYYCGIEESARLCAIVRSCGGMYATHMRSEGRELMESVKEVVEIARRSGARLEISHAKAAGKTNWGKSAEMLDLLGQERRGGLDVALDVYPYTAYGSSILDFIPPSYLREGVDQALRLMGEEQARRQVVQWIAKPPPEWENPYTESSWHEITITSIGDPHGARFAGKTIGQVASQLGLAEPQTVVHLMLEFGGRVKLAVRAMDEEEMRMFLGYPEASIVSDAGAYDASERARNVHPHPRAFGAFARALGRYVREEGVLSWQEAIRKMTSLPASRAGIGDRGLIREGMKADVVLFDPERVRDRATYDEPWQYAEGIAWVIVNGVVTVEDSRHTGARAGRLLRRDQC